MPADASTLDRFDGSAAVHVDVDALLRFWVLRAYAELEEGRGGWWSWGLVAERLGESASRVRAAVRELRYAGLLNQDPEVRICHRITLRGLEEVRRG